MAEFSTSAELDVVVNNSSLRSAKQQIEDELGGAATVNANATASNQLRSDGGMSTGRGGVADLLTEQQQTNAHLEDNLQLNETRNDLLRELVESADSGLNADGRRPRGLRGIGGLIGGGLALGALIAKGLASVNWSSLFSRVLPDLSPGDLVRPIKMRATALIAGGGATITAAYLISKKVSLSVADVIAEKAEVALSELIKDPVEFGADALLTQLIAHPVPLTATQVLDHLVEDGSGSSDPSTDPETDPSTDPSGGGFIDDVTDIVTDPKTVAASAGAGAGAAILGAGSGIASGISGLLPSGASGFGAGTAGSMSVTSLGPMAAALVAAGGTAYGTSQLAEIAGGGNGIDTVHNAGEDFSENNPNAADTIHDAFTNNPVHGAGQWVSDQVNNDDDGGGVWPFANGGIVTDRTEAVIGEGGEPEAVFPLSRLGNFLSGQESRGGGSVTVDATIENVDVSAEGTSREEITQRTLEEIRRELMRQLPDDISNTQQRRFESRL